MAPVRSCIACRKREGWENLFHVVLVEGQALPDPHHTLQGRGAWIHLRCLEVAKSRKSFERALKVSGDLDLSLLEESVRAELEKSENS